MSIEKIKSKIKTNAYISFFSKYEFTTLVCKIITVLICILTAAGYFSTFENGEDIPYPLEENITAYDPYVQQFDAFMKGQLNIDFEPSDEFLEIENPYDPEQRDGVYYLYDRAYFDGKYYSYFGVAPIVTVIMPHYKLTGTIPSAAKIQFVFMIIFAIFMPLCVFNLGKKVADGLPAWLYVFISYVAYISSAQLIYARGRTPFYYIAATSAMAFLAAFAYMFFKGVFSEKSGIRCIWFLFAGLMFALCFHSRINTAFAAAFFIVPVLIFSVILKKRKPENNFENFKGINAFIAKYNVFEIVLELLCLALFVVIGFAISFIYNKERFGSILDFGANYQLTVGEVSKYKLDLKEIGYSIYHYFLAPIGKNAETDAMNLSYVRLSNIGRYLYVDGHFGIFAIPFMISSIIIPFIASQKKYLLSVRLTLLSSFVGSFIIAWVDFCLGGVIYRYLSDFSGIFAVISAIALLILLKETYVIKSLPVKFLSFVVIFVFCIISLGETFKIMFIDNGNFLPMDMSSKFASFIGVFIG